MTGSLSLRADRLLFTPGPLTTSATVKQAMLHDLGSRDAAFIDTVRDVRRRLVALAGADERDYTAVLVQGSGTFGIESVLTSVVPPGGKLLVIVNGAYGRRMVQMAGMAHIACTALATAEDRLPDLAQIEAALAADSAITHVAVVHCETTTGLINPIEPLGKLAHRFGKLYIVDAMSSFGAVPVDLSACRITYMVSSSNKCIEGVPGFSFVLARRAALLTTRGWARSLSLDLLAQWEGLEANGQFRFTPPTHAIIAFHQALLELEAEGGVTGRAERYRDNYETLVDGMRQMGFHEYLAPELQGYIITSFYYPADVNFRFEEFYQRLSDRGFVIYPGKLSQADCFRIGNIGRIHAADVRNLLDAIHATLGEMQVTL